MKTLRVTISLELKGDAEDSEMIKEDVYNYLQELMESDELEENWDVVEVEEDEDSEEEL
jgi:hypothetical protein